MKAFAIIVSTIALVVGALFLFQDHFVTENINNFAGLSDQAKEQYFAETFPSRKEIEDYLFDVTVVTSDPPFGNDVTYFDKHQRYFDWYGRELKAGRWFLVPKLNQRFYNGHFKLGISYSFCRVLDDGSFTDDNCIVVANRQQVRAVRPGVQEIGSGDIFNLSKRQAAPFPLPHTSINIEQIASKMKN